MKENNFFVKYVTKKKEENKIMEACKRRAKFASKLYGSGSPLTLLLLLLPHCTPHVHASSSSSFTKTKTINLVINIICKAEVKEFKKDKAISI